MSDPIPFADINEQAIPFVRHLANRWVPGCVESGEWIKARVPWREDKNPSFAISLKTGWWRDFGGTDKGDMIDLLCRLRGYTKVEAAKELAKIVGHEFGDVK